MYKLIGVNYPPPPDELSSEGPDGSLHFLVAVTDGSGPQVFSDFASRSSPIMC